jgi:hypothetical protein
MASEFESASHDLSSGGSSNDKHPLVKMVLERLRETRFFGEGNRITREPEEHAAAGNCTAAD